MDSLKTAEKTLTGCHLVLYGLGRDGEMEGMVSALTKIRNPPQTVIVVCRSEPQKERLLSLNNGEVSEPKVIETTTGDDGSVQAANTNESCVIDVVDVCTSDEEMRSAEYVNSIADKLKTRYGQVGHIVTMNDTHQLCWKALWSLVGTEGSFLFLRMNGFDSGPTPFALLNEAMEAANDTTQSVNDLKVAFDTWNDHCSALCGTVVEMMESGWNGLRLTILSPEQLKLTTFNPAG